MHRTTPSRSPHNALHSFSLEFYSQVSFDSCSSLGHSVLARRFQLVCTAWFVWCTTWLAAGRDVVKSGTMEMETEMEMEMLTEMEMEMEMEMQTYSQCRSCSEY